VGHGPFDDQANSDPRQEEVERGDDEQSFCRAKLHGISVTDRPLVASLHRQRRGLHHVRGLFLILPENRYDSEHFLFLNQTGQVVADVLHSTSFTIATGFLLATFAPNFRLIAENVDSTFDRLW
jgi:hypothetical protein